MKNEKNYKVNIDTTINDNKNLENDQCENQIVSVKKLNLQNKKNELKN